VRILNQDFFETLISFIISQNKQIPHIKQIVHTLSERYGDKAEINGHTVHLFPTLERLNEVTEDELRECKVGFRAPYIKDAVTKVYDGTIDETALRNMNSDDCMNTLMTIKGVGTKVASCVMLFSLGKRDSFPIDVWMKRIMENMYFDGPAKKEEIAGLAKKLYGDDSGYAQQYLFYYGRELNIGK
jgi:N-glycosylase/DNA lyase